MQISFYKTGKRSSMFFLATFFVFTHLLFLGCEVNSQTGNQPQQAKEMKVKEARVSIVYSDEAILKIDVLAKALEQLGLAHKFDYKKYQKIARQLVKDDLVKQTQIHAPKALTDQQILLVQTKKFLENIKDINKVLMYLEVHIPEDAKFMGMPVKTILANMDFEKKIMTPFRVNAGGTILAARKSLDSGIGINIGGGFHHAKPNKGEGFCLFADVPIAIRVLQKEKKIKKALVIDVDAHKGNGTAYCLKNDPTTFTFSMHEKNCLGSRGIGIFCGRLFECLQKSWRSSFARAPSFQGDALSLFSCLR